MYGGELFMHIVYDKWVTLVFISQFLWNDDKVRNLVYK